MKNRFIHGVLIIFLLLYAVSCSGIGKGNTPVIQTDQGPGETQAVGTGGQAIWGLWQVSVNKYTGEVDITQTRTADMFLNALSFMEPPPLTALSIDWSTLVLDQTNNKLEVVVNFTHPFQEPDNVFVGFDVKGIVFGSEIENCDGFTPALSPQYFSGVPFGYTDGLLGAPKSYGGYYGDLWQYKYFAKGIDPYETLTEYYSDPAHLADRGQFPEGTTISRFYQLDFGPLPGKWLVFNYAVLASFDWPVGVAPFTTQDFPTTTSNCPEPFCVSTTVTENTLYYGFQGGGGTISVDVEVFDWQGVDSTGVILMTLDGSVIPETLPDSVDPGSTAFSSICHFIDVPATPTEVGPLEIVIKAIDPGTTYGEAWLFGLMPSSNQFYDTPVYSIFPFSDVVEVHENQPPAWVPQIDLLTQTLCRSGGQYNDSTSTYDYNTTWDVLGDPVDPDGDPWSKWYYISTSTATPTGSPVGWTSFTGTQIIMNWGFYDSIAPDRFYLWVRSDDDQSAYSTPVRWTNQGGEIELCKHVKSWDNNFSSNWNENGYGALAQNWIQLWTGTTSTTDSWSYNKNTAGWILGDITTTDEVKVEFTVGPSSWTIGTNELSLRISNNGGLTPSSVLQMWTGAPPSTGSQVVVQIPSPIGGSTTAGSTRTFGWYLDDLSLSVAVVYIDNMGIYAHPL